MKHTPQNRGFIALISILIISTVLLATTLSLAQFGIANRFFILDLEQKAGSEKLAEACVHIARVRAYNDPAYDTNVAEPIIVGGGACTIHAIDANGDETTIETTATNGRSVTNFRVLVDNTNGDFLEWEEVGSL
jgi:hypothetical protein